MTDGKDRMSLPQTTGLGLGAPLAIVAAILTSIPVVVGGASDETQAAKYQRTTFAAMASIASSTETLRNIVPATSASARSLGDRTFHHISERGRMCPVKCITSAAARMPVTVTSSNSTNRCVV